MDLKRLQYLVTELGKQEDDIFIRRHRSKYFIGLTLDILLFLYETITIEPYFILMIIYNQHLQTFDH